MSSLDNDIDKAIDYYWNDYDKDCSGELKKSECKGILKAILGDVGFTRDFPEARFESCFRDFDNHGYGTVSRDKMREFFRNVYEFW